MDATLTYSLLPELQVGLGFKKVMLDYKFTTIHLDYAGKEIDNRETSLLKYDMSGPTFNIGGQICLANIIANLSMFGTFSYGVLKTDWGGNQNDYTRYHSTDLGLSLELPQLSKQVKSELQFGYRAQTIYTEAPMGDASDNTEGFTLGLRLVF